jgi:siroheme synthase
MVASGEKVTEALLDKLVTRHERVTIVKKALNEAKQIEAIAKTAVEAFRHRKDMLVQHGATEREEMKGELVTKLRSGREEDLSNLKEGYLKRVSQNAA